MVTYTTAQISELTGATIRQLQFWRESGYIVPLDSKIKNHGRLYSPDELQRVRIIMAFRRKGVGQAAYCKQLRKARLDIANYAILANGRLTMLETAAYAMGFLCSCDGPVFVVDMGGGL